MTARGEELLKRLEASLDRLATDIARRHGLVPSHRPPKTPTPKNKGGRA